MATQNITAETPSNKWIHFLLSFLWPPTSKSLWTSPLFLFSPTGLQNSKDITIYVDKQFYTVCLNWCYYNFFFNRCYYKFCLNRHHFSLIFFILFWRSNIIGNKKSMNIIMLFKYIFIEKRD